MPIILRETLVIVPCGAKKRQERCRADQLYLGCYHRLNLAYARTLAEDSNIRILSAKYGLVKLNQLLDHYEQRLGVVGSIVFDRVREQAKLQGLIEREVIALGGGPYTALCRLVWPDCQTPLKGRGGIGKQQRWLKESTNG